VLALIEAATSSKALPGRRYRAPEGPNGSSVVTSVRNGDLAMLLGADLEASPNQDAGWKAVVRDAKPTVAASILKIPHHGSAGAHDDVMWTDLAEQDPVAIIAPWSRGVKFLPTRADLDRIMQFSNRVFLAAPPSLVRAKKDRDLERMIRKVHSKDLEELQGWGRVQARRKLHEADWRVELDGDAAPVN
jgi:hypothetical protein